MKIANLLMAALGTVALSGCVVETMEYSDAGYSSHPGYVQSYRSTAHGSHYHPRHAYQTQQRTYTSTASRSGYSSSGSTRVTRSGGYSSSQHPVASGYSSSVSQSNGGYSSSQSKSGGYSSSQQAAETSGGYSSSQSKPTNGGYSSSQQQAKKQPRVSSEMNADVMKNGYYFAA